MLLENDQSYQRWLDRNPDGYVLNVRATLAPGYAVLHRAQCPFVNNNRYSTGAFTERAYRKVCATTTAELKEWLTRYMPRQRDFSNECPCSSKPNDRLPVRTS